MKVQCFLLKVLARFMGKAHHSPGMEGPGIVCCMFTRLNQSASSSKLATVP